MAVTKTSLKQPPLIVVVPTALLLADASLIAYRNAEENIQKGDTPASTRKTNREALTTPGRSGAGSVTIVPPRSSRKSFQVDCAAKTQDPPSLVGSAASP